MRQYRLIYDQPTSGKRNMAVDEAIMTSVTAGESFPTLRLYAWDPPCLSLGYGQSWRDADLERLALRGWDLVRRPTGGRAILHIDELTYSVSLAADDPLAEGSIVESYRRISQALRRGLERLRVHSHARRRAERNRMSGPVCFEVPSHYEITTADGRKMVGSAQFRRVGGVLQHGSLPLHGDVARICDALAYESEAKRETAKNKVRRRAATLADALGGQIIAWQTVADAIVRGFEEAFDIEFVEAGLSENERDEANRLTRDVYGADAWTCKK